MKVFARDIENIEKISDSSKIIVNIEQARKVQDYLVEKFELKAMKIVFVEMNKGWSCNRNSNVAQISSLNAFNSIKSVCECLAIMNFWMENRRYVDIEIGPKFERAIIADFHKIFVQESGELDDVVEFLLEEYEDEDYIFKSQIADELKEENIFNAENLKKAAELIADFGMKVRV